MMEKAKLKIQTKEKNAVSRNSVVTLRRRLKVWSNIDTHVIKNDKIQKQDAKYKIYHVTEKPPVSLIVKNGKTQNIIKHVPYLQGFSLYLPFTINRNPLLLLNLSASSSVNDWKINNDQTQKTDPNATLNTEDGIRYTIRTLLEPEYQRGFRRFGLRGLMGTRTGTTQRGYAIPSASWSAGDPNLGTWNDKSNITTVLSGGTTFEYPFTDTGIRISEDPTAVTGDRQQSAINFIKSWIDEKQAAGDPVEFYIYDGYQLAFHDTAQTIPARGNLSMELFSDSDWINDVNDAQSLFPLPDFSKPSHVQYREGEVIPYRDRVGVYGFIVDASGRAGDTAGGRPPGYFDFYRNRGLNIIGEATPLVNQGGGVYTLDEDLYKLTPYMGYYQGEGSGGDFWGNRDWSQMNPSTGESEIHIILTWGFQGAVSGWNSRYWDGVSYDYYGMTSEIKAMREAGYVVGAGFAAYQGSSPQYEVDRTLVLDYLAQNSNSSGSSAGSSAGSPAGSLNLTFSISHLGYND